jgi:HEAT repeat protein
MPTARSTKRQQLAKLLLNEDFPAVAELAASTAGVVTTLMQMLFDPDSLLHWRATEAIGYLAKIQPRKIKEIIPRLLWSLNEDSASFGWGAAAALGEIGRNNYEIVQDITLMLFNYLEEEFTREGMLWGLGRLGQAHPQVVQEAAPAIQACLADPNPQARAYAAWALGIIEAQSAVADLRRLLDDPAPIKLYDAGTIRETTVGLVAREALQHLEKSAPTVN